MVKCVMILWSCLNQLGRISQLVRSACVTSAPHSSSLTGYKHMVLSISSITETKKFPRACWLECKTLVWPDSHRKIRSSLCCLEGGNVTSGRWCHFSVLETKRTHFAGLFFFSSWTSASSVAEASFTSPELHGRQYSVCLTCHVTLLPPRPNLSTLLCPCAEHSGTVTDSLVKCRGLFERSKYTLLTGHRRCRQSCWKVHCSAAGPGLLALEASLFHHLPTPMEYVHLLNSSTSSKAHLTRLISTEAFHDS